MVGAAVGAQGRLRDAAALYLHGARATAHVALEERLAHLRDDARRTNHHSTDGDELVDVLRVQVPHAGHFLHTEWTDLDTTKSKSQSASGTNDNKLCGRPPQYAPPPAS